MCTFHYFKSESMSSLVLKLSLYEKTNLVSDSMLSVTLAEKGGSRTLRGPYGPQTGFEDQRHHRAPSFSPQVRLTNYQGIGGETNGAGIYPNFAASFLPSPSNDSNQAAAVSLPKSFCRRKSG